MESFSCQNPWNLHQFIEMIFDESYFISDMNCLAKKGCNIKMNSVVCSFLWRLISSSLTGQRQGN